MGRNDDRKRKVEAGGKGLSIILTNEAQDALAELQSLLRQRGEPSSQEAVTCRTLVWAAASMKKGKEPSATPASKANAQPHESFHEMTHENSRTLAERMAELEARMIAVEAAMVCGVQPGQWGGL